jgi:hypothetical protein
VILYQNLYLAYEFKQFDLEKQAIFLQKRGIILQNYLFIKQSTTNTAKAISDIIWSINKVIFIIKYHLNNISPFHRRKSIISYNV